MYITVIYFICFNMKILPEPLDFEWDKGNSDKNLVKHKTEIKEIEQVFEYENSITAEDKRHSQIESRYVIFGETQVGRKLVVGFTIRKNKVRVITARDMSRKERRDYEEKIKNNT